MEIVQIVHPLKAYRDRQSPPLTLEALATLLGVSAASVSRWETGERKPDVEILPTISERTGIAPSELRPDLADLFKTENASL